MKRHLLSVLAVLLALSVAVYIRQSFGQVDSEETVSESR